MLNGVLNRGHGVLRPALETKIANMVANVA